MISLTNHQQVSRIEKEFPHSRTYACARILSFTLFTFTTFTGNDITNRISNRYIPYPPILQSIPATRVQGDRKVHRVLYWNVRVFSKEVGLSPQKYRRFSEKYRRFSEKYRRELRHSLNSVPNTPITYMKFKKIQSKLWRLWKQKTSNCCNAHARARAKVGYQSTITRAKGKKHNTINETWKRLHQNKNSNVA